jgi:hypothetical protein
MPWVSIGESHATSKQIPEGCPVGLRHSNRDTPTNTSLKLTQMDCSSRSICLHLVRAMTGGELCFAVRKQTMLSPLVRSKTRLSPAESFCWANLKRFLFGNSLPDFNFVNHSVEIPASPFAMTTKDQAAEFGRRPWNWQFEIPDALATQVQLNSFAIEMPNQMIPFVEQLISLDEHAEWPL